MPAGDDWTRDEVAAAVASYLAMLRRELGGERPSRKAYWAPLVDRLEGRSKGSVEYKFGNISAALCSAGLPYSDGYMPYGHRQALVDEVVRDAVAADPGLVSLIARVAGDRPPAELPSLPTDPTEAEVSAPERPPSDALGTGNPAASYLARHVDFVGIESRNRELGLLGEKWVVELERRRLTALGAPDLAERVEHSSQVHGDGCGFDVLSFDRDGAPLHVEVKTTRSGRLTPFLITARERSFSQDFARSYRLYRVFTFATNPRFFQLPGDLTKSCRQFEPQVWRAWP